MLAAIYVASVLVLQELVRPITAGNGLAVAASTLGVVALFQPMRRQIQTVVDRRFYRSRHDATRVVATFVTRLGEEVELDHLTSELAGITRAVLRPNTVSVWIRERTATR